MQTVSDILVDENPKNNWIVRRITSFTKVLQFIPWIWNECLRRHCIHSNFTFSSINKKRKKLDEARQSPSNSIFLFKLTPNPSKKNSEQNFGLTHLQNKRKQNTLLIEVRKSLSANAIRCAAETANEFFWEICGVDYL